MTATEDSTPADLLARIETVADTYSRFILPVILLLALFVRVIALLDLKQTPYFDFMLWDERLYHEWARELAAGTFASDAIYEFAPLPAYLFAGVYKFFSPNIIYIRYANIGLGILTCWLIYRTGREINGKTVGLAAALFTALYKPFIFYNIVPLKSSLTIVLFAAFVYCLIILFNNGRLTAALCTGLFLGLVNNVRPNVVVLVPLVPLLITWVRCHDKASLKPAALLVCLYAAGLGLAHAPFMVRNYQVAGRAAPITSQGGTHFYMCNQLEYPEGIPFVTHSPAERGIQFTIEASRREGRKLNSKEASDYWTRQALKSAIENPGRYLVSRLYKIRYMLNCQEEDEHYHLAFMSGIVPFFKLPFLAFGFIMPLGMAGFLAGSLQSKRLGALLLVFAVYAATLILFFSNARMRMPLVVMLLPFAALGIASLTRAAHTKKYVRLSALAAVAGLFALIAFLPSERANDLTGHWNTHAIILQANGKMPQAIDYWERSSRSEGEWAAFANLSLAGLYTNLRDFEKAAAYLDRISDTSFAAALKYEGLGDLWFANGRVWEAINAYEKSISINSGIRRIRAKLVQLLQQVQPARARLENTKLEYIDSFYNLYKSKNIGKSSNE